MDSIETGKAFQKLAQTALDLQDAFLASDADLIIELLGEVDELSEQLAIEYGRPAEPPPVRRLDVKQQALEDLKNAREIETREYWLRKGVIR